MFALHYARFGDADVLSVGPLPEPHAGPGEIRIRVVAAGVSPVDVALRTGLTPAASRIVLPHVPGVDAAGVVDEVGSGVTDVFVGDEVFGSVDIARLGGASAEFAVLSLWARRPQSMSWEESGSAGTSIETATRVLDLLDVGEGTTLLIDGAAGGVGSVAVQLAIARGARVVGTGRAESREFLAGLGADPVVYGPGLVERVSALALGPIDRALDIAGAGSLPELITLTGSASAVVTIADFSARALGVRLSMGEMGGEAGGRYGLAVAAALAEEGRFRVPVRAVFPLGRGAEAHVTTGRGPRHGKVALRVS
ncbi:MAG: Alcohol dehydrogenase GroES domain protein [Frondihabitans sp.]|nr:Alcohol dehydrogenase GroES domain protein [Frondihabitans sp.]